MSGLSSNPSKLHLKQGINIKNRTIDSSSHTIGSNGNNNGYQTYPTSYPDLSSSYSMSTNNIRSLDGEHSANYGVLNNDKDKNESATKNSKAKEVQVTFPQRLLQVLSEDDAVDVISWLPHGKSFIVYDKKKFVETILPRFFKESKFTSFTRKLNRWGFTRISRGVETGAYQHEYFLRDDPDECLKMKCQKKNEKKANVITNPRRSLLEPEKKEKTKTVEQYSVEQNTPSPPPLSSQMSVSTMSSADVPPLKNTNPNSNYLQLMKLQQQQREIEQRLQEAVQNASQQPKAQHLFPHLFSQVQQNMYSGQQTHMAQPAGMMNGIIPMQTQSMSTFPTPTDSIGQLGAMPSLTMSAQIGMPTSYLPSTGMIGSNDKTQPPLNISTPSAFIQSQKSSKKRVPQTQNPSSAILGNLGTSRQEKKASTSVEQVDTNTVEPYMGISDAYLSANPKFNGQDAQSLSGDDDDSDDDDDSES